MQCNRGPFIAFSRYVSIVDDDGEDKGDSDWVTDNDSVMMTASLVNNKL
jgi:hypothetical protein